MARILITGAAGFIGSHLAEHCLLAGHDVVGVDCFTDYYSREAKERNLDGIGATPGAWRFVEMDLAVGALETLVGDFDVVFHLAAQPGVRSSWGSTFGAYVTSNVIALQRLLEACHAARTERFVFASSSSVYGDATTFPTTEDTPLRPVSPYGATKALGEHLCRVYAHNFSVPIVMLRYFTVYGPRQRPDMAFQKLITAALLGREITINGDGEQTRDFTFVRDAVAGTYAAAFSGTPGRAYNLGGGSRISMNDVLRTISAHVGVDLSIRYVEPQAGDARDTSADTSLALKELGYRPSITVNDGIGEQVAWNRSLIQA